jgi:flagellar hook-length control protein FliK
VKATDLVSAKIGAQPVSPSSVQLVRQGLSEFQKMWMKVYKETEKVNRASSVGHSAVSQEEAALSPTHSFPSPSQPERKPTASLNVAALQDLLPGSAPKGARPILPFAGGVGLGESISPVLNDLYRSAVAAGATAATGAASSVHLPILPGVKGGIPSEWLTSPLSMQESGLPVPLETADVAPFRDLLDQIVALNPREGEAVVLQLRPGALGDLRVEVEVNARQVRADFTTSDPEVKLWLDGQQGLLQDALTQRGLNVESFSVNVGDPNGYFEAAERRMQHDARSQGQGLFLRQRQQG